MSQWLSIPPQISQLRGSRLQHCSTSYPYVNATLILQCHQPLICLASQCPAISPNLMITFLSLMARSSSKGDESVLVATSVSSSFTPALDITVSRTRELIWLHVKSQWAPLALRSHFDPSPAWCTLNLADQLQRIEERHDLSK